MSSPSNTEFDSCLPDSTTPSTSGQPTMESPPVDNIEHDPNSSEPEIPSTPGQPSIRPPPTSIEHDPDNPPPETPENQASQKEAVSDVKLPLYQRVKVQLPLWKEHFRYFWPQISSSTFFAILAVVLCFVAYQTQMKNAWLGGAWASSIICFCIIWFKTESGPPFISQKDGSEIKPEYLRHKEVTASDMDLTTRSQKKQMKQMAYS